MIYKLICTDMDGTLLNDNKHISDENKLAISKAIDKNCIVALCTGRIFTFANYYAQLLGVTAPVIASNGAYIKDGASDAILFKQALGSENCKKIIQVLNRYNINPHFNSHDRILTGYITESSASYLKFNQELDKEHQFKVEVVNDWNDAFTSYSEDILKCIAIDRDIEKIKAAKEELSAMEELEVVSSMYDNFEVMSKNVSKGSAVDFLAKHYNIKREEIICVGDNENDLSMIEYAGLGIAMGNSTAEVKARANYVTVSNNEHGIAKIIEKFIL